MSHVSNGKVTIVKGVPHKARHALSADCVFYCIEELEVCLLEDVLQELAIDEIVHALEHCDPQGISCSLHFIP